MSSPKPASGNNGWLIIGIVIVAVVAVSKFGGNSPSYQSPAARQVGDAQQALVSAVAEQTPPPITSLRKGDVRLGLRRVELAAVEGLAGQMIYSQNCYDVVGRAFSWRKLDECGGFDSEASLALGDAEPTNSEKEIAWFDSEAAAGRYLKAATAAGLDADVADQRLAAVQSISRARHRVPPPSALTDATVDNFELQSNASDDGDW